MAKMKGKSKEKTFVWDPSEFIDAPEAVSGYLSAALETNDPAHIARAIGDVARARGMTEIARHAGVSRENLYRSLNGETRAEFATVMNVLKALGVQLTASPKAGRRRKVVPERPSTRRTARTSAKTAA
jgi:probable addiction module antidote protein